MHYFHIQSTEDEYKYSLIHLKWQPEMNQVIGKQDIMAI